MYGNTNSAVDMTNYREKDYNTKNSKLHHQQR